MHPKIRKCVFPVAGLGTRFLPATKSIPKEMLPVVDKPLIQYAVDEAREAGIEHFIFVTGRNKGVIEDYFDHAYELEATLEEKGKDEVLSGLLADLPAPGQMSFVRQQRPLGLGHAVWCARELVGREPFAVILPDDIIHGTPGCMKQLVDAYSETGGNVIAVEEVPLENVSRYGIVDPLHAPGTAPAGRLVSMKGMVEKPKPEVAPSRLGITGRYVLQPEIFDELSTQAAGAGGEIQLTDAMARLLSRQGFHGWTYTGRRFDCGDRLGFLAANVALSIDREDLGAKARQAVEDALKG
jgi:UTP--glucose-1-phosphate uridylyltransferase